MQVKIDLKVLLAIVIVAVLAYLPFHLTKGLKTGGADKAALETMIKDYIINNPKVIDESMRKFYESQQPPAPSAEERTKAIKDNQAELNKLDGAIVLANPNGTINMIEFIDFNCGFCKRNEETMEKIANENKNVRWIVKAIPPLGGLDAAKAFYAASAQNKEKLKAFHDAMFKMTEARNKENVLKMAKEVGFDLKRLETDMDSEPIKKQLLDAQKLFSALGGGGVPSIVIGTSFIEGAYPEQTFLDAIAKLQ